MQQDLNLLIFSSTRQCAMSCFRESRWIQQSFSSRSFVLRYGKSLRHLGTYWPLNCLRLSITLYKDQLGRSVVRTLLGLRCHIELFLCDEVTSSPFPEKEPEPSRHSTSLKGCSPQTGAVNSATSCFSLSSATSVPREVAELSLCPAGHLV